MTITVSIADVARIIFLLMLSSIAITTYIQGWRVFCNSKEDTCDRVMGTFVLWVVSVGSVGLIWAIVADVPIL